MSKLDPDTSDNRRSPDDMILSGEVSLENK